MRKTKCVLLFLFVSMLAVSVVAENKMLKATKLVIDDPLTEETWNKHWKRAMGFWKWEGDSIKGIEDPKQNHHAGAGRIESMQSAIIEVEFRLDDSKKIQFGTDYLTKDKKDHLLRVSIDANGLAVRAGKGWGKTTSMKPVGKKVKMKFESGKWYKGRVEFHKQEVLVHINDKFVFYGTAQVNQDVEKNRVALTAKGTASFRNVKMWHGELKSDWDKTQKSLAKKFK